MEAGAESKRRAALGPRARSDCAQARARRLQLRARQEVRNGRYDALARENARLSKRLAAIDDGESGARAIVPPAALRKHRRVMRAKRVARRRSGLERLERLDEENARMAARLARTRTELDFAAQEARRAAKDRAFRRNQALSRAVESGAPSRQASAEGGEPRQGQRRAAASPPRCRRVRGQDKMHALALARLEAGMCQQPERRLRVYQAGRQLDGRRVVVSFYESSVPSETLLAEVYDQASSQRQALRLTVNEVRGALGVDRAQELLPGARRADLCEALAGKLCLFTVDGQQRLLLTSFLGHQLRETALLAEKRAAQVKLGRVPLGARGGALPRRDPAHHFEPSAQVAAALVKLTAAANGKGNPFPDFKAAPTRRKAVGVLTGAAGARTSPRADQEPAAEATQQKSQKTAPEATQAACAVVENAPVLVHFTASAVHLQIEVELVGERLMVRCGPLNSRHGDSAWTDCTDWLPPNVRLRISLLASAPVPDEGALERLLARELERIL